MFRPGCLVVLLAVAAGLFFGDQAVTRYAEQRVAGSLEATLRADTEVDLDGWPVSVRLLTGSIPTARISSTAVPLGDRATFDRLSVELTDVKVNINDLRKAARRLPAAERGTFEAELSEASVARMLGIPTRLAEVRLRNGGLRLRAAGLTVDADITAEEGNVVVRMSGPLAQLLGGAEFTIDLSEQPGAPAVREVQVRRGVMLVRGVLEDVRPR